MNILLLASIMTAAAFVNCAATYVAAAEPTAVYRCIGADGRIDYTSVPANGCAKVFNYDASRADGSTFHGYPCTQDCSGHEAGYAWAQARGITNAYSCGGKSASFINGCLIYVKEHGKAQAPRRPIALTGRIGCSSSSHKCQAVCDAADALKDAADELSNCAAAQDFGDDCSVAYSGVQAAHDEYESAVSEAEGDCD